jgi:Spy/CpxP family protein refolding chaperone
VVGPATTAAALSVMQQISLFNSLCQGTPMKTNLVAVLFAVATMLSPAFAADGNVASDTDMQALRNAVRANKKALVSSTLSLTDAEAQKFWPIYEAYQRDLDLANRRRNIVVVDVVGSGKPISDLYAKNLANELLAADEAEIKSRRTMQNKVMKALPDKKAARYLQLESKIRAYQDYDIAVAIPLVK